MKKEQDFQKIDIIDFKKKKVKDKKNIQTQKQTQEQKQQQLKKDNDKRYKQLVKRICQTLKKNNPDLAQKTKIMLKPPQVVRMGKKTAITNFIQICQQLDRDYVHCMNFFLLDLGATGSIGQNSGFIIKNVLHQKNVQNMFRKYITEFVQCHLCKRQNTQLIKDDKMRLWTLHCKNCGSSRTVPTIKGAKQKKKNQETQEKDEKEGLSSVQQSQSETISQTVSQPFSQHSKDEIENN